jgi:A/G-specific adenine glycosylase
LFDSHAALVAAVPQAYQDRMQDVPAFTHVLTHKDLHLHPVRVQLPRRALEKTGGAWHEATAWSALGLPAPVRRLLAGT